MTPMSLLSTLWMGVNLIWWLRGRGHEFKSYHCMTLNTLLSPSVLQFSSLASVAGDDCLSGVEVRIQWLSAYKAFRIMPRSQEDELLLLVSSAPAKSPGAPTHMWLMSRFCLAPSLFPHNLFWKDLPLFVCFSGGQTELLEPQRVPDIWLPSKNRNRAEITSEF